MNRYAVCIKECLDFIHLIYFFKSVRKNKYEKRINIYLNSTKICKYLNTV